ncbi:uracil-DNA glycosylase family protein [Qingshengfaniella alkalisoli]|uniref:Uracil-DNA glycosylase family protein n=2 Tax=Qingshengfaniella alkalisoli TaxID=2599296 RepID=A0A5B8J082_9RHOB|nr:uracil-DNA glycosylase family protein [Qingshengfaniella alkalisoli]
MTDTSKLQNRIARCRICSDRFAATATQHRPRPVVWFRAKTPILIAGQAPGMQVHQKGIPFHDRSGDRLRTWLGMDAAQFYDRDLVSILPTSFCFPGYSAKGSDLPPPPICWDTWHADCLHDIGVVKLRVIVGGYAIRRHTGLRCSVTEAVRTWRKHAPETFLLPHPSWRNTRWLKANPWFDRDVVPALQSRVKTILTEAF